MPTLQLIDPGVMLHVVRINAGAFFFARCVERDIRLSANTCMVEDIGADDIEIMDFVEALEGHLGLKLAKPVMVSKLGELADLFEKALSVSQGAPA